MWVTDVLFPKRLLQPNISRRPWNWSTILILIKCTRLSLPWTSFRRSTSPCADAFRLNILRASASVSVLSLVFPLVRCCRTARPNSFAKLWNAFLYRSFPSALVSSSISSLRFTLAVRLSKPFRCLWTQLSLCVMALRTGIKDKRGLVEPLYWF